MFSIRFEIGFKTNCLNKFSLFSVNCKKLKIQKIPSQIRISHMKLIVVSHETMNAALENEKLNIEKTIYCLLLINSFN